MRNIKSLLSSNDYKILSDDMVDFYCKYYWCATKTKNVIKTKID